MPIVPDGAFTMDSPGACRYPLLMLKFERRKAAGAPTKMVQPKRTQTVSIPAVIGTRESTSKPKYIFRTDGAVRIVRREFVGTVSNGSNITGFVLDSNSTSSPGWDFNPGVSAMFPWLSNIALAYERFKFHRLEFDFVSSNATSSTGRLYAAIDYDWDDEVPTTKTDMMSNLNAKEVPMWDNLHLTADPKQLMRDMPWKYVNTAGRTTYTEPRTAYSGFLIVGFHTGVANQIFDLWVEYDVELEVPVIEKSGATLSTATPTLPTTPYVKDVNPWYSGTMAAAKIVQPMWEAASNKGLIREVVGALGDTPTLATPSGVTSGWLGRALDLGRVGVKHWITLQSAFKHATTAPVTIGAQSKLTAAVYDGAGTLLGELMSGNVPVTGLTCSELGTCANPGEESTSNKYSFAKLGFSMESLRTLYRTARYVAPYLVVQDALGLGSVAGGVGIDWRLW